MTEKVLAENQLLKDRWKQLKETITEIKDNNEFDHKDELRCANFYSNI